MLTLLTEYLLKYKKLTLPHVGTFEVETHSPSFDVVNQLMHPPASAIRWKEEEPAPLHQLVYLQSHSDHFTNAKEELEYTGKKLASILHTGPFEWNGIGVLQKSGSIITIDQDGMGIEGFEAVPAYKVIREGAVHQVLVGDKETDSQQIADAQAPQKSKTDVAIIIGWVLLLLAVLAVLFFLYKGQWQPQATGLKLKTFTSAIVPQY